MKTKNKALEERVFKNAKTFISRNGIKGWNMNDLASDCGTTKRTLYKIIESKEQLVREVLFRNIYEIRDKIFELIQAGDDFLPTLDRIILEIAELMKNNFVSRYSDILNEYPELENEIVKENEIFFTQLRDFLSRGIAEGYLISELTPDFIYRSFLAVFFYFIKYSKTQDEAADSIGLALRCLYRGTISYERV